MKLEIERKDAGNDQSTFDMIKSKDMTWLEAIGVLEIAKKEILDGMQNGKI